MTTKPDLTRVWASGAPGGNIEDPDVTVPGKFAAGWDAEIPPFENFNFLQQLFTQALAHANEFGIMQWDTNTEYPLGGLSRSTVDNKVYESTVAANQSNEPSASPSEWVVPGSVNVTIIESDTTYNPPAGVKALEFMAGGAGGGGGAADGQGSGTAACSGPGGSGGRCHQTTTTIESSYAITVGAAGLGAAPGSSDGGSGGDTTVTSTNVNLTANGGGGGTGDVGGTGGASRAGGTGGTATGGTLNIPGETGGTSRRGNGDVTWLGDAGTSPFGARGVSQTGTDGSDASGYGAGGGGTAQENATTNRAGGDGAPGIVIIKEYF